MSLTIKDSQGNPPSPHLSMSLTENRPCSPSGLPARQSSCAEHMSPFLKLHPSLRMWFIKQCSLLCIVYRGSKLAPQHPHKNCCQGTEPSNHPRHTCRTHPGMERAWQRVAAPTGPSSFALRLIRATALFDCMCSRGTKLCFTLCSDFPGKLHYLLLSQHLDKGGNWLST
jgi:hypothetical protein